MAIEFNIQVRNGKVTITVGGHQTTAAGAGSDKDGGGSPGAASGNSGGQGPGLQKGAGSPGAASGNSGGEGHGSMGGCSGPVVIGPIVVDASGLQSGPSGNGGSSPGAASGNSGGGKPARVLGGGSPGAASGNSGGGPQSGSGSGCCCPIVIGPIVISGFCSGQDPASSDDPDCDTESAAVTVNPPLQVVLANNVARGFLMQPQLESFWCWAAVAVSVNDFLAPPKPGAVPGWTQPTLATALLKEQGVTSANCGETPVNKVCNQPEALDVALGITGNLLKNGALFRQHLTFECIQNWVNANLPVAARIKWRGNGAHFVVVDGCKVLSNGQLMVHLQDPASTATTSPGFWDYDAFVENYEEAGFWDDTYLLTAGNSQVQM
jgi:hypothetical protein